MTVAVIGDHTAAILTALQAAGINAGNATSKGLNLPHAVIYTIAGGRATGELGGINANAELLYQATCTGRTAAEAEFVEKEVITALLAGLTVTNRRITHVRLEQWGGMNRDDDAIFDEDAQEFRPLWFTTPRFRLFSVPA